jgi:hypothetical protein
MLFNALPIPKAGADPVKAWMPGTWRLGGQEKIALAPLQHYSPARIAAATHVVTLHSCEEYSQAVAAAGLQAPPAPAGGSFTLSRDAGI